MRWKSRVGGGQALRAGAQSRSEHLRNPDACLVQRVLILKMCLKMSLTKPDFGSASIWSFFLFF